MMQKAIGPSFVDELSEAGNLLGEHFTWDAEGNLYFFDDTPTDVRAGVEAVYAAHDPNRPSWSAHKTAAQTALSDSDVTVMRCYESGVTVPAEWVSYRKSLRAIVGAETGDATKALPTKPEYPADT